MLREKNALLVQELNKLIRKYGNNSKIRYIIKKEFEERNKLSNYAIRILTEKLPLETLDIENQEDLFLLFIFALGMQRALSTIDENINDTIGMQEEYSNINVASYFTKVELEKFNDLKLEKKEVSKYPYVFKNMIKVAEGHWIGVISAKYLADIDAGNDIIYNFKTQRDPKIDVFGIKKINIDKTKIEEIKNNLLEGKQFPTEIKINLLKDGEDDIEFISKDGIIGDLKISSGTMNSFDGYHRKTANSLAINENPELDSNWKLCITNFSEKKAQDYMVEIDKQKPIKQEHIKNINTNLNENVVVDYIVDNSSAELAEQIKNTDTELKFGGLTKKSILATAISEQYSDLLKSKVYIKQIADWIVEVSNYFMGLYIDEFIANVSETKKYSYINHKNMFVGYIALTRYLYQKDNWKEELKEILNSIDFNVSNPIWKEIDLKNDNLTKTTRKQLYRLFKKGEE